LTIGGMVVIAVVAFLAAIAVSVVVLSLLFGHTVPVTRESSEGQRAVLDRDDRGDDRLVDPGRSRFGDPDPTVADGVVAAQLMAMHSDAAPGDWH